MNIALGKMSLHSNICFEKAVAYMGPSFIFSLEEDKEQKQFFHGVCNSQQRFRVPSRSSWSDQEIKLHRCIIQFTVNGTTSDLIQSSFPMTALSGRATFRILTENLNENYHFPELLNGHLITGVRCSFHFLPFRTREFNKGISNFECKQIWLPATTCLS